MINLRVDELKLCRKMILERRNDLNREDTLDRLKSSEKRILEDIEFYKNIYDKQITIKLL